MAQPTQYYCERFDYDMPKFEGYTLRANSDKDAVEKFYKRHGNQLMFVYSAYLQPVFTATSQETVQAEVQAYLSNNEVHSC